MAYVDNAYNRSLGRVGMAYGSAVVSRSAGSTGGTSSSCKTYVDSSYNRSLNRVGLPYGTAISSRANSTSSTSKIYVDNAYNLRSGRVELDIGTEVHSRGSVKSSKPYATKHEEPATRRVYADNEYNRRIGRVGFPIGSVPCSLQSSTRSENAERVYVDNALNRRLGRVGLRLGSMPHSDSRSSGHKPRLYEKIKMANLHEDSDRQRLYEFLRRQRQLSVHSEDLYNCERVEGIVNRHQAVKTVRLLRSIVKPLYDYLPHDKIIEYSSLVLGEKLGGGGFGDVHFAIWRGEYKVAVKKLRVQRISPRKKIQFEDEVRVLSKLDHPAIVTFYGACIQSPYLAIVMEFMGGGSLYDVIHVEGIQLSDKSKMRMIKDCFSALKYLHTLSIAHRDIKSSNVLVCEDLRHCKLGDFGLALKDEAGSSASVADFSVAGTLRYSPPEVLEGTRLTIEQLMKVDVYSMGLTVVELLTETEPFAGMNVHELRAAVIDGNRPSMSGYGIPYSMKTILRSCLKDRAKERPSAATLMDQLRREM